ncbi:MAG: universal stress protein [Solirubrobacteraceae bacterium]
MPGPVLFCYDGSQGSRGALQYAAELLARATPACVLTVWEPASVLMARAGGFGASFLSDESEIDGGEEQLAREFAEEGAALAREHGFEASYRVERVAEGPARAIIEIADELDASVIVCGRRGRGAVASTLLGSVSRALVARSGRAVLVAPEGSPAE